ncbi:Hypothetical predicted protein [Octopus vulgaris]|uniref:Uncharacterized protein n=1 Tax=Octopus vulgaris TaxID=6645 RepID=A0AA36AY27_OCTVU|nr:Hypothetical predicted protein [Octopus vulgaris]
MLYCRFLDLTIVLEILENDADAGATDIFIEPPDVSTLTDETSGGEEECFMGILSGKQLVPLHKLVFLIFMEHIREKNTPIFPQAFYDARKSYQRRETIKVKK